jgi:hypothetical protein
MIAETKNHTPNIKRIHPFVIYVPNLVFTSITFQFFIRYIPQIFFSFRHMTVVFLTGSLSKINNHIIMTITNKMWTFFTGFFHITNIENYF